LLGNAVKFTDQGGIGISARTIDRHGTTIIIEISVRDSGVGIASDSLGKIFNPFTQEDASISRTFGGTGLGLTITQRLVELMGGSISVESTPGAGSCFSFILPFTITDIIETASAARPVTTVCWDGPKIRVLFAEDNDINIQFGTSLFKKLEIDYVAVENGRECLEALQEGHFDIVLMDIQMPVMTGEEALLEIRRQELGTQRHQPVLAVTAYALRGEMERFLEDGFDGYVAKPLLIEDLVNEMKRVLGRLDGDSRQVGRGGQGLSQPDIHRHGGLG
ncbi:MAG TPA: response regulator, partial [Desulfuromonadales bacterium]|nr:response regulator [Desulfuromonadales bacterium]